MATQEQMAKHNHNVESLEALGDTFFLQVGGHPQGVVKTTLTGKLVLFKGWLWATVLGVREDCKTDTRKRYAFVIKSLDGSGEKYLCTRQSFKLQ